MSPTENDRGISVILTLRNPAIVYFSRKARVSLGMRTERDSELESKDDGFSVSGDKSERCGVFLLSALVSHDTVKKNQKTRVELSVELSLAALN